ncbi:hypothetical protein AALP_AA4G065000 [Arabis alpina]|uniref:MADS-box domain-containing protein n=1 Tax=Arabis alpina TaxID=50452 RepID=A0A087H1K0_ARAAL|nr:hypothetical protein AALP_AA4G065000 [Arabis alpina]
MKYTENMMAWQMVFTKCLYDLFKEADAFERECNVEVDIVIFPSAGPPYVFKSSCVERQVRRFRKPNLKKRRNMSSMKQERIPKRQAKIDPLSKELERNKEHEKVPSKKSEEILEKCYMKDITALNLEETDVLLKKIEDVQNYLMSKDGASSSSVMPKDGKD